MSTPSTISSTTSSTTSSTIRRRKPSRTTGVATIGAALAALLVGSALASCGTSSANASDNAPVSSTSPQVVDIGKNAGKTATPVQLTITPDPAIRAEVPKAILDSGKLVIGVGALPAGFPPLAYVGDDQKTLTGSEPDLGRLIAAVFGLKPDVENASWENLFVRLDSGQFNVGLSNITDTEERKEKYDFASYRQDNLGFEVLKSNPWNFAGNYENLSGKTVAVGSGTNQEKILLEWSKKLKAEGKPGITPKYYQDNNATLLALDSGRIDAYFAPNPGNQYQIAQTASGVHPLRSAGTFSGAGATLQGLIAATTKKDDGLVKPLNDAINLLIKNGQYATWLKAYGLTSEAVPTSEINPPGLPKTNS
jgi:polar amino acid transport system substrate-binding protein